MPRQFVVFVGVIMMMKQKRGEKEREEGPAIKGHLRTNVSISTKTKDSINIA